MAKQLRTQVGNLLVSTVRGAAMLSDFELGYEAAIRRLRGISPSTRINTNHEGQHWMRLCALYLEEYKEIDVAAAKIPLVVGSADVRAVRAMQDDQDAEELF